MSLPVYVIDELRAVTEATNAAILATIQQNERDALGETKIEQISFQNGVIEELIETLAQLDKDEQGYLKKYPLVYVAQPFTESRGKQAGVFCETSPDIYFIHQTQLNFKITDREEKVQKPVLDPIYFEFLHQCDLRRLMFVMHEDLIPHDYTFLPLADTRNKANKLNDYVDAILVQNLNLKFYTKNC